MSVLAHSMQIHREKNAEMLKQQGEALKEALNEAEGLLHSAISDFSGPSSFEYWKTKVVQASLIHSIGYLSGTPAWASTFVDEAVSINKSSLGLLSAACCTAVEKVCDHWLEGEIQAAEDAADNEQHSEEVNEVDTGGQDNSQ